MTFSEQLGPQAMTLDEYAEGTTFHLPVFLFQGAEDVLTPPGPARRFHDQLTAPLKDFTLIPDASHFAAFRRPDVFLELLVGRVRPVVTGAGVDA